MSLLKDYKACIYARLLRDDGDKLESDSITNQRALIKDFISKHPEIHLVSEKPMMDIPVSILTDRLFRR